MDIFDNLPSSVLEGFHEFRESRYNFLYLCKSCSRSFDSRASMESCKFCSGEIIELRGIKRGKRTFVTRGKKTIYRYYCPTCERNFMTTEQLPMCNSCRTDYLHVYTWDTLRRRDKLYIKLNKSLRNVFSSKRQAVRPALKIPSIGIRFSGNAEEMPTN